MLREQGPRDATHAENDRDLRTRQKRRTIGSSYTRHMLRTQGPRDATHAEDDRDLRTDYGTQFMNTRHRAIRASLFVLSTLKPM